MLFCCGFFFFEVHFAVILCVVGKRSEKTGMLGSNLLCFSVK